MGFGLGQVPPRLRGSPLGCGEMGAGARAWADLGTQGPVPAPEPDGKYRTRWTSQAQLQVEEGLLPWEVSRSVERKGSKSVEKHSEPRVGEGANSC